MKKYLAIILVISLMTLVSSELQIFGDDTDQVINLEPPEVVPFSNASFNQSFGDGKWWRLDGSNDNLVSSNWDMGIYDLTADWFNGKFNWTSSDDWNLFDGSTLTFNNTKIGDDYLRQDGTTPLTGNWNYGGYNINGSGNGTFDSLFIDGTISASEDLRFLTSGTVALNISDGANPKVKFFEFTPDGIMGFGLEDPTYSFHMTNNMNDMLLIETTSTNIFSIRQSGGKPFVGIGTNQSTHTLDVVGEINATENITSEKKICDSVACIGDNQFDQSLNTIDDVVFATINSTGRAKIGNLSIWETMPIYVNPTVYSREINFDGKSSIYNFSFNHVGTKGWFSIGMGSSQIIFDASHGILYDTDLEFSPGACTGVTNFQKYCWIGTNQMQGNSHLTIVNFTYSTITGKQIISLNDVNVTKNLYVSGDSILNATNITGETNIPEDTRFCMGDFCMLHNSTTDSLDVVSK